MADIFVTGAEGQLGHDVVARFRAAGHQVTGAARTQLDITSRADVVDAVVSAGPDVVVNCAAHTHVDACETDVDAAYAVNALGVRHLTEAALRTGSHLVHLSTDYVFSGDKPTPYHEWDSPDPRSVYGASKLAGEREVGSGHTIVRTSWVCGEHGPNMVKTILRLADEHDTLSFVDDQVGNPTFTTDLAGALLQLADDRRPGLFHITNSGAVSWYEFARAVLAAADLDPDRVRPISTADLDPPRPAPRPANSVLENRAWRLSGLPLQRDFREPLAELVHRLIGR